MTDTDDLLAWLRAQVDEDERLADKAVMDPVGAIAAEFESEGWRCRQGPLHRGDPDPYEAAQADALLWAATRIMERARPKTLHDLPRFRRAIESKRALIEECEQARHHAGMYGGQGSAEQAQARTMMVVISLIAAEYADRPGYREEWAP